jgi:hypothetical protein
MSISLALLLQVTIKILQDELAAMEKSQKEMMEVMERQRREELMERQKRQEQDKLMLAQERKLLLKQRQDLQAEVRSECMKSFQYLLV